MNKIATKASLSRWLKNKGVSLLRSTPSVQGLLRGLQATRTTGSGSRSRNTHLRLLGGLGGDLGRVVLLPGVVFLDPHLRGPLHGGGKELGLFQVAFEALATFLDGTSDLEFQVLDDTDDAVKGQGAGRAFRAGSVGVEGRGVGRFDVVRAVVRVRSVVLADRGLGLPDLIVTVPADGAEVVDPEAQGLDPDGLPEALDQTIHEGRIAALRSVSEALDGGRVDQFVTLLGVGDGGVNEDTDGLGGLQLKRGHSSFPLMDCTTIDALFLARYG